MHNYKFFLTFIKNITMTNTRSLACSLPADGVAKLSLTMSTEPRIYTSYFGNSAKLKKGNVVQICIAQFAPRFSAGVIAFKKLAPTAKMLKAFKEGSMGHEEFDQEYEEILGGCNPKEIYEELLALGRGNSVAIMCYEKPPDTCHRHSVSKWFASAGLEIKEYPF